MLTSTIKNCKTKKFPDFIRNSTALINSTRIDKIFPEIGLTNDKENTEVKLDFSDVALDKVIHLAVKRYVSQFKADHHHADLKGLELFKVSQILYVLEELDRRFTKAYGLDISASAVKLSEPIPSYDGKALFKVGTDVFKLTKALIEAGSKYAKVDLVTNEEIEKECKNLQIVFSSDGIDGAWDLATMSMRGIKSCMRWEARQSRALVGSITDPCCGIIYLTNGAKTQYGSKMLFRALVRVVVDESKKPALILDRLYSSFYKNKPDEYNRLDLQIRELFVNYLKKRVNNCTVLDAVKDRTSLLTYYYLPQPDNIRDLAELEMSYRDTPIQYAPNYFSSLYPGIIKQLAQKQAVKSTKTTKKTKTTKNKSTSKN
jgi:hypothetical protein